MPNVSSVLAPAATAASGRCRATGRWSAKHHSARRPRRPCGSRAPGPAARSTRPGRPARSVLQPPGLRDAPARPARARRSGQLRWRARAARPALEHQTPHWSARRGQHADPCFRAARRRGRTPAPRSPRPGSPPWRTIGRAGPLALNGGRVVEAAAVAQPARRSTAGLSADTSRSTFSRAAVDLDVAADRAAGADQGVRWRSHGRALKRYWRLVSAPTGQSSIVLPENERVERLAVQHADLGVGRRGRPPRAPRRRGSPGGSARSGST